MIAAEIFNPAEVQAIDRVLAITSWNLDHVRQVERLATALFDATRDRHGLDRGWRRLLSAAALLHDVGYPTDPARHHKVSARMIRTELGDPFKPRDIETIALLARYHRKSVPSVKHRRFGTFGLAEQRHFIWVAGILRVADGLDRAHARSVSHLEVSNLDNYLVVTVSPEVQDLDLAGATQKRSLLERAASMVVLIRAAQ